MRVLYGVMGEGMGHATRSKVVCEYLKSKGHEVKIAVSGRACEYLKRSFSDVVEIRGLTIRYVDNAMDLDGTLAQNVLAAPEMLYGNLSAYYEKVVHYEPDIVFTDFDSFAYFFAKRHRVPIVSVDNQQIIARFKHDDFVKAGAKFDYQLTKAFVKAKVPGCDHYVVTSFFSPTPKKKHADSTTLVPPILRASILEAKQRTRCGDYVLVYQTSTSDSRLLDILQRLEPTRFLVYGLGRDEQVGNCTLKSFSEAEFVEDLAGAQAVVANGGLSLLSEAIFLGKPIYSVPVRKQFEQVMNARYIESLGYGLACDALEATSLRRFITERDRYAEQVARHAQDGNSALFQAIDSLLETLPTKPPPSSSRPFALRD